LYRPEVTKSGNQSLAAMKPQFPFCFSTANEFIPICLRLRSFLHLFPSQIPGNVHSAEGWEEFLLPEIKRQQRLGKEVVFRADAAFAKPEIYEALESRGVKYAIRIPANEHLERDVAELLPRPVGHPRHKLIV
jgi:DDE family transposase